MKDFAERATIDPKSLGPTPVVHRAWGSLKIMCR